MNIIVVSEQYDNKRTVQRFVSVDFKNTGSSTPQHTQADSMFEVKMSRLPNWGLDIVNVHNLCPRRVII